MSANHSFSSREDNFDDLIEFKDQEIHPLLKSTQLYSQHIDQEDQSKNCLFYYGLRDSIEAATDQIKLIFKQLDSQIQIKQLEKKVIPYSILNTLLYTEKMFQFGYHQHDDDTSCKYADDLEDFEPNKAKHDQWMRSVINVDQIQPIEESKLQNTQKNIESDRESSNSKHSSFSHTSYWKKTVNTQKAQGKSVESIQEVPAPVNMEKPLQYDEFEERVRVIKQLECKRKLEMEQQELKTQEEIKKQQQTFKKDIKGLKFTYDFDGKILNTKGVKSDKLPPANYTVSFTLKDENVVRLKETLTSKSVIKSMINVDSKQNLPAASLMNTDYQKYILLQQQAQKEMFLKKQQMSINTNQQDGGQQNQKQESQTKLDKIKNTLQNPTPFEYDSFIPSQGVKLIYEQKIKEGIRYKQEIQDLEQLDRQLKMHKENEPLHITKSEYHKLTENGNLNRNMSVNNPLFKNIGPSSSIKNSVLSPLKGDSNKSELKEFQFSQYKSSNDFTSMFKADQQKRAISLHSTHHLQIKVENPELIRGLFFDSNQVNNTEEVPQNVKKFPKLNRNASTQQNKSSPNDLFNLSILDDQGWGKGKGGIYNPPQQKIIKKPTINDFKKSVNQLYKLPRQRDILQTIKQQEQEVNLQLQQQIKAKSGQVKQIVQQHRDMALQQGFRQSFYSTRSVFENQLRSTYGNH